MCARNWLLLALWLFCVSVSSLAADPALETLPPLAEPSPPTSSQPSEPMPTWSSFESLLTMLEAEASASRQELTELLNALVESRTEASALSSSLALSELSRKAFESSMVIERDQAHKALEEAIRRGAEAERSRDFWRTMTISATVFGVLGWAAFAVSIAF